MPRLAVAVLIAVVFAVPPRAAAIETGSDGIPARPAAGLELPCAADGGVFGL